MKKKLIPALAATAVSVIVPFMALAQINPNYNVRFVVRELVFDRFQAIPAQFRSKPSRTDFVVWIQ